MMKLDRKKYELAMARTCKRPADIKEAGISGCTLSAAFKNGVRPATIGRIANAIGCDVTEILLDEE
jgi:hypothetical protein|nr:MAG TPA: hypothetical protein [Caudoviricetes sp.]